MEKEEVDINGRRQRTTMRKKILEKKKVIDGLIKAASSLKDPLASFPDFMHYKYQGLCFCLEGGHGARLPRSLKQYVQKLVKLNMEKHFGIEWPTEEKKGDVVGFVHYRFILEEELPVLYVYELQLEPRMQGKGLGKFLMQLLELIAQKNCMFAVMLTVQKANLSALYFYTKKLGYCISSISPSRVDPLVGIEKNYEILIKAFDQEAKTKLEILLCLEILFCSMMKHQSFTALIVYGWRGSLFQLTGNVWEWEEIRSVLGRLGGMGIELLGVFGYLYNILKGTQDTVSRHVRC